MRTHRGRAERNRPRYATLPHWDRARVPPEARRAPDHTAPRCTAGRHAHRTPRTARSSTPGLPSSAREKVLITHDCGAKCDVNATRARLAISLRGRDALGDQFAELAPLSRTSGGRTKHTRPFQMVDALAGAA